MRGGNILQGGDLAPVISAFVHNGSPPVADKLGSKRTGNPVVCLSMDLCHRWGRLQYVVMPIIQLAVK